MSDISENPTREQLEATLVKPRAELAAIEPKAAEVNRAMAKFRETIAKLEGALR